VRNNLIKYLIILLIGCTASKASLKSMALDPYWIKITSYETDGNSSFQILENTLKQLKNNKQTICKYPLRYKWLNQKLNLNYKKPICKELNKFLKYRSNKASIVFTSQRFNSPASVFGHTFLKLYATPFAYIVNYTADVKDKENQILYAYRGLTGKYKSKYRIQPYTLREYIYMDEEFRDLLEFELKLNKDELENIIFYLYEVRNKQWNYYFLQKNCSSELLKLIQIANPKFDFTKELGFVVLPMQIINILKKNNLIGNISKKKAKLKLFYNKLEKLNKTQKAILYDIVSQKISISEFDNLNISQTLKNNILILSIMYIEIKSAQNKISTKYIYTLLELIKLKNKYKINSNDTQKYKINSNPLSSRFHKLSIGYNNIKDYKLFGYRHLYRNRDDLVDKPLSQGTVEVLDLLVYIHKDNLKLDHLTLINLESLPVSNIFFKEPIKKIKLGYKRVDIDDKLYGYIDYAKGYRYNMIQDISYSIYPTLSGYYNHNDLYSVSLNNDFEYNYNNKVLLNLRFNNIKYSDTTYEKKIQLIANIKLSKATKIDLIADLSKKDSFTVVFSYLF
jgi:hypothetical protein